MVHRIEELKRAVQERCPEYGELLAEGMAPADADRALAELKKVGDEGPTAAAFDKVKEFLQKSYAHSIKENGYWLGQLTSFYRYGTDSHTEYLKTLNAITPEDIARLAKKISDSPNRVEVVMNGIAKQE